MKNIKKTIAILFCVFAIQNVQAQLILKGGVNFTNYFTENNANDAFDYSGKTGFHIGLLSESKVNDGLGFETGILIDTRGARDGSSNAFSSYEQDLNPYYATIPINLKLRLPMGDNSLFIYGGPYMSIGVAGKLKSNGTLFGSSANEEREIKWGDTNNDDLKRFDYGFSVGGGIEINNIVLGVDYGYGLANIAPNTDDGNKIQNRMVRFSAGFILGE